MHNERLSTDFIEVALAVTFFRSLLALGRLRTPAMGNGSESSRAGGAISPTQVSRACLALISGLCFFVVPMAARADSFAVSSPGASSSCSGSSSATSCTGTFDSPEAVFLETFSLTSTASVTIQTYGFGGGVNAAGASIAPGGFDSLIALFSGSATAGTILESGGNPLASSDASTLYSPGCPPAGSIAVGSVGGVCGDNELTASLHAGTYTLLLTDSLFIPLAVDPNVVLGPYDLTDTTSGAYGSFTGSGAYTDLTGGVFQTCVTFTDCNIDTGNFAVDVSESYASGTPPPPAPVPEPLPLSLVGSGLLLLLRRSRLR